MAVKVFFDTNIILDILDDKRPFSPEAIQLWEKIENDELDAFISESILTTTDYILQKIITKSTRLALLTDFLGYLQILPCSTTICQKAIKRGFHDLEDAILYQIALENDIDYFITNDTKALKKLSVPSLPVVSSQEFLRRKL